MEFSISMANANNISYDYPPFYSHHLLFVMYDPAKSYTEKKLVFIKPYRYEL